MDATGPETDFIVWKGSWFWLFTHFGAIKSPRRSRGLFIAPKCVKSQNQLPLHSKMLNSSHCCEGSVLTEDIWIISEKWKWNFKCMPVFQKFASVCSYQWKWKDVCFALEKNSSEIQTENVTCDFQQRLPFLGEGSLWQQSESRRGFWLIDFSC